MTIILFLAVLSILIFVHEFGHFIFAKWTGMRVDEFAIGFPPRIWSKKVGETRYSLNLIPVGGYVKIYGEEYGEEIDVDEKRKFTSNSMWAQAVVLSAGVFLNLIFAWVLLSGAVFAGMEINTSDFSQDKILSSKSVVLETLKNSPAQRAGFESGDIIYSLSKGKEKILNPNINSIEQFTSDNQSGFAVNLKRGEDIVSVNMVPENLGGDRRVMGVALGSVGKVDLNILESISYGFKQTVDLTVATTIGLYNFFSDIIVGNADFSSISGPVGIANLISNASDKGFLELIFFTALISINLAVINFLPFPALDGGRLLFVIIEAIKGSPIKPVVANTVNLIGFALLILLMVVVTFSDIMKLF